MYLALLLSIQRSRDLRTLILASLGRA